MARILLADDEAASRELVARALETDGHSVTTTASGHEALDHLIKAATPFDALVTDINMPGMDGLELAAKAIAHQPGLGIVLMSGFVEQLERAKSLNTKRFGVLAKPFTLENMRAHVRNVLAI